MKETCSEDLFALYRLADVLVITPIRDGFNLRPVEFVVCREAEGSFGQVVLSEFAGRFGNRESFRLLLTPMSIFNTIRAWCRLCSFVGGRLDR